ncbi:hypothetical protein G6F66_014624 [Rhizopus arrhizus]|nr:hypothetical protein G6F66_014624 [Rhizopus arrhizus]
MHAGLAQLGQRGIHDAAHRRFQVGPEIARQSQAHARGRQGCQRLRVACQHGVQQHDILHAVGDGPRRIAGVRDGRDACAVVAADRRPEARGAVDRGGQAHGCARVGAQGGGR